MTESQRIADLLGDDPIRDTIAIVEALRRQVIATKIEMSWATLDAVKRAVPDDRPAYPWMPSIASGVPVIAVDDVEDGKARVTFSDGSVKVIP